MSLKKLYSLPETSIDAVRKQYEGTDVWMKAPNGKPTNLTERQWLQVRTPEFKNWFGDWEQANVNEFVEKAIADNLWHSTLEIPISSEARQRIENFTGETFGRFVLTSSDGVHMMKNHGDAEEEAKRNQEAITPDIIKVMPWLLNNFDTIEWSGRGGKVPLFCCEKN